MLKFSLMHRLYSQIYSTEISHTVRECLAESLCAKDVHVGCPPSSWSGAGE